MKAFRLELFTISLLMFGLQVLFVRSFHLFFTALDVQAIIPWSFSGILISCVLLTLKKHRISKWLIDNIGLGFVGIVLLLYALSCFFIISQTAALVMVVLVNMGLGMSLAKSAMRLEAYSFYVIDFLGGIVGSLLAFFLPSLLSLEATYVFFVFMVFLAVTVKSPQRKPLAWVFNIALGIVFLILSLDPTLDLTQYGALYQKPGDYKIAPYRHGQLLLQEKEYKRSFTAWSSVGKVEVQSHSNGASEDLEFFVSNINYFTLSNDEPRTSGTFGKGKKALVIGAGGGLEMRFLRDQGYTDITAVDINEVIYKLMSEKFDLAAGKVFSESHYVLGEGRNFVETNQQSYDMIVINYVGAAGGLIGSSDDLSENYLFTKDAFNTYYRHLNKGGLLAIGLVYSKEPKPYPLLLRTVESAAAVLRDNHENPTEQFWVLGHKRSSPSTEHRQYRGLVIMRKGERAESEEKFIYDMRIGFSFPDSYAISYPPEFSPAIAADESSLGTQERLTKETLKVSQVGRLKEEYQINIAPVSDNNPYFFQFSSRPQFPLPPAGFLFWSSCFLIMVMGLLLARKSDGVLLDLGNAKILALSSLLGFAYGILEIALLNSFTIVFSSMIWNFSLLVFGLLLGSVVAGVLGSRIGWAAQRIAVAVSAVLLLMIFLTDFRSVVFSYSSGMVRSLGLIGLTLIIAVGVSFTYPMLLKNCEGRDSRMPAFVLGFNSGFFIIGSILCRYLALVWSLKHAFLVVAVLYLLVACILPKPATKS